MTTSTMTLPDATDQAAAALMNTELGNAERLVLRHGDDLRHCPQTGQWLAWDGTRWAIDETGVAMRAAKATVRAIYREATQLSDTDARVALAKHAAKSEEAARLSAMLRLARTEPGIPVRAAELDADPWLFNVANGTLDLRSGRLLPHRRQDLCTRLSPVVYDPDATCPRWERFLGEVFDDAELPGYLQKLFGYALTGDTSDQSIIVMHGDGANGKTTLLNVLLALAGDYGLQAAPDLLLADRRDAHPTAQADLQGRRPVVTSEVNDGRRFDEARLKRLTGGDLITARRMRQDFYTFVPTHTLFLAVNHKPQVQGDDHGIWRRLHPIPFRRTFDGSDRDPQLAAKLTAELPGILAWAVRGTRRWQDEGHLDPPDSVVADREVYRAESNPLATFIEECCDQDPAGKVSSADLNAAYLAWHRIYGHGQPLSQRAVGLRLGPKGLGYTKETKGTVSWLGLKLKPAYVPSMF